MRYRRLRDQSSESKGVSCELELEKFTYSMGNAKSLNNPEQGTTKSPPIMSVVELCESKKSAA
jgi:hypothetical protein